MKSAQNQFPVITQAERMVDRTGKPVEEMIAEERESSSAQIRTMLNEQRRTIIAEYGEKFFITNSLQFKQNMNAEFYRRNYGVSNMIFLKFINKILLRWRNYENSRVLLSICSPDRNSLRIRTLLWNYLEDCINYRMK